MMVIFICCSALDYLLILFVNYVGRSIWRFEFQFPCVRRLTSFIALSVDVRRRALMVKDRRVSRGGRRAALGNCDSNFKYDAGPGRVDRRTTNQPPIYVLIAFVYSAVASRLRRSDLPADNSMKFHAATSPSSSSCNNPRRAGLVQGLAVHVVFPTEHE